MTPYERMETIVRVIEKFYKQGMDVERIYSIVNRFDALTLPPLDAQMFYLDSVYGQA